MNLQVSQQPVPVPVPVPESPSQSDDPEKERLQGHLRLLINMVQFRLYFGLNPTEREDNLRTLLKEQYKFPDVGFSQVDMTAQSIANRKKEILGEIINR